MRARCVDLRGVVEVVVSVAFRECGLGREVEGGLASDIQARLYIRWVIRTVNY